MEMRKTVRDAVYWVAEKRPEVLKSAVWMWSRVYLSLGRANAPLRDLLNTLDYRLPAKARLGNGMKVIVPWNDDGGRAIYEAGYYEPQTVRLFAKLLAPGMMVFDVGANIGQYTLVASEQVGPTGEVHSFEPDPTTFQWLSRNVALNKLGNVHLNETALFSEVTTKPLFLATARDTGSNSLVGAPWTSAGRTREVSCTTLDEYARSKKITSVDVIKIDIEGAELPALQGAAGLLGGPKKPLLILEFEEERQRLFGTSCAKLAELLTGYGYALFKVGPFPLQRYVSGPDNPPSLNVLGIPEARVSTVLADLAKALGISA
jgi:FkbM family methyltransferase